MHRRQRHLNPAHAGATCALDARFISGVANGANISSWSDRSSLGNSPTNGGSNNNKPLYQSSGISGQPSVLFDGVADATNGRNLIWATSPVSGASEITGIIAFYRTTGSASVPGAHLTNFGTSATNDHTPWVNDRYYTSFGITFRVDFAAPTTLNTTSIETFRSVSNSFLLYSNSSLFRSEPGYSVSIGTVPRIGSNGGPSAKNPDGSVATAYFWTGHIGCLSLYKSGLSDSLRRRIENAYAFSYKMPCN